MTNCPQRRFESFVRWQIARRDVLSHLSGDKSFAETFWAVCQMTNCPQRRFEPFVRWQIVPRGVLGRVAPLPQEKWRFESISILEFLLERVFLWIATLTLAMTGESPLRLLLVPSLNFTNSLSPSDSFPISGAKSARILFGRLAGGKIMDCHADVRNDGWKSPLASPCPLLEFHKLPQSFGQLPIRGAKSVRILFGLLAGGKIIDCHAEARNDGLGTWVYKSFFTKIVSGGNLSKVFPRAWG